MSRDDEGFLFKASHVALLLGGLSFLGAAGSAFYVKFQGEQNAKDVAAYRAEFKDELKTITAGLASSRDALANHEKVDAEGNRLQDLHINTLEAQLSYMTKLLEELKTSQHEMMQKAR